MCNGYDIDDHTIEPGTQERPSSPTKASTSAAAFTLPPQQSQKKASSTKPASKKMFFSGLTKENSLKLSKNIEEHKENGENKFNDPEAEKSINYKIICALIENKLGNKSIPKNSIPTYIINSFNEFCRNKKVIT
eukprot:UN09071